MLGVTTTREAVNTGTRQIAEAIGGSIQPESLVIISGESNSGKSILCQHLAHSTLLSNEHSVAYYTIDESFEKLIAKMDSLSLHVEHYFVIDRLRIYPLSWFNSPENAEKTAWLLINHIRELPARFKFIIVDTLTPALAKLNSKSKMDLFQAFKELCDQGRSVIMVTNNHLFEKETLFRTYLMSDYYLNIQNDDMMLWSGQMDNRAVKILNVLKLRGAEIHGGDSIKFEINPRAGIQILPFVKVKI